jgi:hypothetical protein
LRKHRNGLESAATKVQNYFLYGKQSLTVDCFYS